MGKVTSILERRPRSGHCGCAICVKGVTAPRIRYTRKSTEEDGKQIASHEQQTAAMDLKWGPTNTGIHFQDSFTGTTFERPGFQELLAFCRSHKQLGGEKGVIEVYDMSRFGRILYEGEEDPEAVLAQLKDFLRLGWEVRFSTFESTGNRKMDWFQNGLYAMMAAETSAKLSRDVRRGRSHFLNLADGARWLGGKRHPFGTLRSDPVTGKVLGAYERTMNKGGTILVPNEDELAHWKAAAESYIGGASFTDIAARWNAEGVRSEYGVVWTHFGVKRALTNPVLIGEMHIEHEDPKSGTVTTKVYKAAWQPMVPLSLWGKLKQVIAARTKGREPSPDPKVDYRGSPAVPICAKCGVPYSLTQRRRRNPSYKKPGARVYRHPNITAPIHPEWRRRIEEAGCRSWSLNADFIEDALKDLIVQNRTSGQFAQHLSDLISDRTDLEKSARKQREQAERRLKEIEREQQLTIQNMTRAQSMQMDDAMFWRRLDELSKQIEEVKLRQQEAIELEQAATSVWDEIQELINETKNIESIWATGDQERRLQILNWWVRQVLVVPVPPDAEDDPYLDEFEGERAPAGKQIDRKYIVAFLRTAPNDGVERLLTRKGAEISDYDARSGSQSLVLSAFVTLHARRWRPNRVTWNRWIPLDDATPVQVTPAKIVS